MVRARKKELRTACSIHNGAFDLRPTMANEGERQSIQGDMWHHGRRGVWDQVSKGQDSRLRLTWSAEHKISGPARDSLGDGGIKASVPETG